MEKEPAASRVRVESNPHLEILYSQGNQTADHMIERVTHRLLPYGPVVVVTNDHAERKPFSPWVERSNLAKRSWRRCVNAPRWLPLILPAI